MTTFRPCFGCTARNDCEIKKGAVKALRGIPVTSAKIKCDLPFTRYFPPGTRALVMTWDHSDPVVVEDEYRSRGRAAMSPATVVGRSTKKPGKVLLHLDSKVMSVQQTDIEFVTAWPKDLQKLDEPRADFCTSCNRAFVHDKCSCPDDRYEMSA